MALEGESAHADAAPTEHKRRRRSGRPRSGRSRGALSTKTRSEQRDAGGPHLGVRHLEQAVAFSLAPASLAACCVETSLRASDLFEFELPPPVERQILDLVLAGAAEAMSEKRNPGDTLAARAARSAGAAIRWSLELQQRPPDAVPQHPTRPASKTQRLLVDGPRRQRRARAPEPHEHS